MKEEKQSIIINRIETIVAITLNQQKETLCDSTMNEESMEEEYLGMYVVHNFMPLKRMKTRP